MISARLRRLDPVVVAAVVVGALVRLVWVAVAARQPVGLIDQSFYLEAAERLLDGEGYTRFGAPSAYYPPGYPFLLAAAMAVVRPVADGGSPVVAGLLNVVVTSVAIAATAVVARRLSGPRAARCAAWLAALLPSSIVAAASALTEPTYIALMVLGLVGLVAADGSLRTLAARTTAARTMAARTTAARPVAALLAAGLAWGAAALVRPVLLLGLPVLLVASGWGRGLRGRTGAAIVVGVVAVVLAPWAVRNAVVMDRVALSTNTGDNLCIGHHDGATGEFRFARECLADQQPPDLEPETLRQVEIERDVELTRRAVAWAVRHPLDEVRLVPLRVWHTLAPAHESVEAVESYGVDPWMPGPVRLGARVLTDAGQVGVLVLGAWGTVRAMRRRRDATGWWAVVAAAAGPLLSVVVFFGDPRFAAPVIWLAIFGVAALREPDVSTSGSTVST